jgi:hypothetical protein
VAGMHTIHESSNENGKMLGQFATRNNMLIKSTVYPHKCTHLGTWKIPGTDKEDNQIHHVLKNVHIWEHGRYLELTKKLIRLIMY